MQDCSIYESLRTHRWLLAAVLRSFPNGSVNVFDRDLRYLYAAGTGLTRAGLGPAMLIGQRLDDLFPAEAVDRVRPFYTRTFVGETVAFTLPVLGREYAIRAWPLREANGVVDAIVVVADELPARPQGAEELTPRQREVAALVADGLSNKEIARRLGLAAASVRGHVEQIMRRLGFARRTQIGVWATARGLHQPEDGR
jgi:DNA-binding CsgD family transcriptional regulator